MIFLSHSWTTKPIARRVLEALALEHLPAWIDEQQLEAGARLRVELLEAVSRSDIYLYLVSPAARDSAWVQDELGHALALERESKTKVVPVRLTGDETVLPPLLTGRVYRTLDASGGGGVARLANELRAVSGAERVPPRCRLSASVKLLPTGLLHTLKEARMLRVDGIVDTLLLDEKYERLDERYWRLSERQFPDVQGTQRQLEYAASVVNDVHAQSRRTITEVRTIADSYVGITSDGQYAKYFEAGMSQAMRVLLHRLAWNCDYLTALRDSVAIDEQFVARRNLGEPFDGHACEFVVDGRSLGSVNVPEHGNPFAPGTPLVPWGLTSPFADMLEDEIGKALGDKIARRFLAGTMPSTDLPDPAAIRYGLA